MDELRTDEHGRPEPPHGGDEASTLSAFLDYQRATFEWKCRGLSDAQLQVALPPSSMTLGGMLKHLALVEDYWCTEVVAGHETPEPWSAADLDGDPDWEWTSASRDSGDDLRALWMERVERSRAIIDAQLSRSGEEALAQMHAAWDGEGSVSLRWVLVHLVEEYARHNGHADLLRESIDGETGE